VYYSTYKISFFGFLYIEKESYGMPDRLLTIPTKTLRVKNKINQKSPNAECKKQILDFLFKNLKIDTN
jgi:hypothetical protein